DAPILVRRTRKHSLHEFAEQFVLGIEPPLRLTEHLHRDRWQALVQKKPLMGGRVVDGPTEGKLRYPARSSNALPHQVLDARAKHRKFFPLSPAPVSGDLKLYQYR